MSAAMIAIRLPFSFASFISLLFSVRKLASRVPGAAGETPSRRGVLTAGRLVRSEVELGRVERRRASAPCAAVATPIAAFTGSRRDPRSWARPRTCAEAGRRRSRAAGRGSRQEDPASSPPTRATTSPERSCDVQRPTIHSSTACRPRTRAALDPPEAVDVEQRRRGSPPVATRRGDSAWSRSTNAWRSGMPVRRSIWRWRSSCWSSSSLRASLA